MIKPTGSLGNAVSLDTHYLTFGPNQNNRSPKYYQIVVPLEGIEKIKQEQQHIPWKRHANIGDTLCIKTPILTRDHDIIDIIESYVIDHYQENDILCIAESPLAIIQNRYIHHSNLDIKFASKILCRMPNHLSSLATPGGTQTLINEVGLMRTLFAGVIGGALKLFGFKGWFYRLAGQQAKLIDSVSGTIPPYDKSIVFGPTQLTGVINQIYQSTRVKCAIVDVNDLKKVDILACHPDCNRHTLFQLLKGNPSGNANEQTPLTLIRPWKKTMHNRTH